MHPAAIVLAGGGSRRMGRDKAWLELDGRPLLARVIELLGRRCSPIVVSTRPGRALPELVGIEPWRVDDPTPDAGPLVGLHAALERLRAAGIETAYLSSCDAAGLSERHVEFMLERLRSSAGAIAAVPVESDGRRHPLAAAIAVEPMHARASAQLAAGASRLQTLFDDPRVVEVPITELPDPEVLAPCNTPQQWAALLSMTQRSKPSPSA
jgi:molybdopterin-guanine dinucleotide biosynthesis protein A